MFGEVGFLMGSTHPFQIKSLERLSLPSPSRKSETFSSEASRRNFPGEWFYFDGCASLWIRFESGGASARVPSSTDSLTFYCFPARRNFPFSHKPRQRPASPTISQLTTWAFPERRKTFTWPRLGCYLQVDVPVTPVPSSGHSGTGCGGWSNVSSLNNFKPPDENFVVRGQPCTGLGLGAGLSRKRILGRHWISVWAFVVTTTRPHQRSSRLTLPEPILQLHSYE